MSVEILIGIGVGVVSGIFQSRANARARRQGILDQIEARDAYYADQLAGWEKDTKARTEAHAEYWGATKAQAERVAVAQLSDAMNRRGVLLAKAQDYAFSTTEREGKQIGGGRGIRGFATHGTLVSSDSALARLQSTRSRGAEGVRRLEAKAEFEEKRGLLQAEWTRESVIEPKLVLEPEPIKMPVPGEDEVNSSGTGGTGGTGGAGGTGGTGGTDGADGTDVGLDADLGTAGVTLNQYGSPETEIEKEQRLTRERREKETKDLSADRASRNQYRNQKRDMESKLGRDLTTQEKVNIRRETKVDSEDLWIASQLQSAILFKHKDTDESGFGEPPPTGLQKFTRELAYGITGALEGLTEGAPPWLQIKKLEPPQYERTYANEIQYADDSWYDPLMFDPTEGGNQPGYRPVSEGTRIRRELGLIDTDRQSRGLSLLNRLSSRDLKRIHERLTKGGGSWTEGGSRGHKISDISAEWDVIAAAEELGINIMQDPNFEKTQASQRSAVVNESGRWDKNWLQRHHDMVRSGQITYDDEDQARKMGLMPPTEEEEAAAQARADRRDEESDLLASAGTYMPSDLLMFTDEEEYLRQQEEVYSREHGLFRGKAIDFIESDEFIEQEEPRAIAAGLTSAMEDEIFADLQYLDMGGAFDVQSVVDVKEDSGVEEPEEDRIVVDRGTTGLSTVRQVEDPTLKLSEQEELSGTEGGDTGEIITPAPEEEKEEVVAPPARPDLYEDPEGFDAFAGLGPVATMEPPKPQPKPKPKAAWTPSFSLAGSWESDYGEWNSPDDQYAYPY